MLETIPSKNDSQPNPLNIQDYLTATSDASLRARTVSFLIVAASLIVFAALLNSIQWSWMLIRIQKLNQRDQDYVVSKIGKEPSVARYPNTPPDVKDPEHSFYEIRYNNLYAAYTRTYVENTFAIRVPFFGFTFDVNDLGLLGGLALLILLTILGFCLSREINNLELSFVEAGGREPLKRLYTLLAMRQVFTVPQTSRYKPRRFVLAIPKVLCFLPLGVHTLVTIHDGVTTRIFWDSWRVLIALTIDVLLLIGIGMVTYRVITRLMRIDLIWSNCWQAIEEDSSYVQTDPNEEPFKTVKAWWRWFREKDTQLDASEQPQET